jgi:hypothetical protein
MIKRGFDHVRHIRPALPRILPRPPRRNAETASDKVASDEMLEAHWDAGDPAGPGDRGSGLGDGAATKEAPGSRVS